MLNIEGHTDSEGNDKLNVALSKERAKIVKQYLVKKVLLKVAYQRLGKVNKKPIADNKTEEGKTKNRRVELYIKK